jgi:hypothetical protein
MTGVALRSQPEWLADRTVQYYIGQDARLGPADAR